MTTQIAFPTEVRPEEVAREKTLGGAIELCAKVAGYEMDKQLQQKIGVDKAQFSRWMSMRGRCERPTDGAYANYGTRKQLVDAVGMELSAVCGRVNSLLAKKALCVRGFFVDPKTRKRQELVGLPVAEQGVLF